MCPEYLGKPVRYDNVFSVLCSIASDPSMRVDQVDWVGLVPLLSNTTSDLIDNLSYQLEWFSNYGGSRAGERLRWAISMLEHLSADYEGELIDVVDILVGEMRGKLVGDLIPQDLAHKAYTAIEKARSLASKYIDASKCNSVQPGSRPSLADIFSDICCVYYRSWLSVSKEGERPLKLWACYADREGAGGLGVIYCGFFSYVVYEVLEKAGYYSIGGGPVSVTTMGFAYGDEVSLVNPSIYDTAYMGPVVIDMKEKTVNMCVNFSQLNLVEHLLTLLGLKHSRDERGCGGYNTYLLRVPYRDRLELDRALIATAVSIGLSRKAAEVDSFMKCVREAGPSAARYECDLYMAGDAERVIDLLRAGDRRYKERLKSLYEAALEDALNSDTLTVYMAHIIAEAIAASSPVLRLRAANIIHSELTQL